MKHHYFIGKLLNPEDDKNLRGAQNFISKAGSDLVRGKIFNFSTKFAYIGYLDDEALLEFQDKFNNIFESITSKISPFNAEYTKYGITGLKTTKKSISILYESPLLEKVIVPYIKNYVNQITEDDSTFYPHVSLARIDANKEKEIYSKKMKDNKNLLESINMPRNNSFTIDSIDILKGTLKEKRFGQPSKLDEMDLSTYHKYKLRGVSNTNVSNANKEVNINSN